MARKLRVEYPGAIYHVMNRGDRREPIFKDDADRQRFVETLGEVCAKTGWQVHAYVLMPNQFHLVVETPQALASGRGNAGRSENFSAPPRHSMRNTSVRWPRSSLPPAQITPSRNVTATP